MTNLHVKELILKWVFLLVKSLGQWHTFWTCGLWIVYGKKNIGKKQNFNLKLIEFFFGWKCWKKNNPFEKNPVYNGYGASMRSMFPKKTNRKYSFSAKIRTFREIRSL